MRKSISKEVFIERANLKHNFKYDYSKVNFTKSTDRIIIICPIHGEFKQTVNNHLSKGAGCLKCGTQRMSDRIKVTLDEFIARSTSIHDIQYDYSKTNFSNVEDKAIIICPAHGEFKQRVALHLRGANCPRCKESKGEKIISKWLDEHNIMYNSQHRFPDCRDKKPLPFDFYLPLYNTCIEFDGIQHFNITKQFMNNKEKYSYNILHDNIKDNYCKENNIKIIRISYNEIQDIDNILSIYLIRTKEK